MGCGEESLDGRMEQQKKGDGRDGDLHRLKGDGGRREILLPDRIQACLEKEERQRCGGSLWACVFTAGFARFPCICSYGQPMKRVCVFGMEEELMHALPYACPCACECV